jgi:hypothetical protein
VGDFFSDISQAASGVVSAVSNVAQSVTSAVGPWVGDIVHGAEAAVSLVPGIGTAISDVLATAESAYDAAAAALSGNPLIGAIDAAYNYALSTVPGGAALHFVLDPVKKALEDLAFKKEPVESAVLDGILQDVPDAPKIGPVSPRSVAASIAHLIVSHLGVKNTGRASGASVKTPPKPALKAVPPVVPPKAMPLHLAPGGMRRIAPVKKPLGVPHAGVHVSLARQLAPQLAPMARAPGSPGAPPGATHWHCTPLPAGEWQCAWR